MRFLLVTFAILIAFAIAGTASLEILCPSNQFGISSACRELTCSTCCIKSGSNELLVPRSNGQSHPNSPPSGLARTLVVKLNGVNAQYNGGNDFAHLYFASNSHNVGLGFQVWYDFNSDGTIDRQENYPSVSFTNRPLNTFFLYSTSWSSFSGHGYQNLNRGTIYLLFWQTNSASGDIAVLADSAFQGQLSTFTLPYRNIDYITQCSSITPISTSIAPTTTGATTITTTGATTITTTGATTVTGPVTSLTTTSSTTTATSTSSSSTTVSGSATSTSTSTTR